MQNGKCAAKLRTPFLMLDKMTPSRPYLLRALYDWIVDNGLTPHVLVDASKERVVVPREYVEDGKIVFNISPSAVQNLQMGNETLSFSARFSGKPWQVEFPVMTTLAVYARENGKGMVFTDEEGDGQGPEPTSPSSGGDNKPGLRLVK